MSKIVGHFVHQAMLRRETLSALKACYVFSEKRWDYTVRLWPAVVRELVWCQGLLVLQEIDMRRAWPDMTLATDASPWGAGVCKAFPDKDVVCEAGRWSDNDASKQPASRIVPETITLSDETKLQRHRPLSLTARLLISPGSRPNLLY